MPEFDPTIPLGIKAPAGAAQLNPLELMGTLADVQNKRNENLLFQQQMLGRKRAGEIMSSAPTLEDGIKALVSDPQTSAFVPELASTMQGIQSSMVSTQGAQQDQAITGLGAVLKAALPAITNPSTFAPAIAAQMETLSPTSKVAVSKALPSLVKSLTDGLPADPTAANSTFQQRLAATLMSAGITPDLVRASTGTIAPQAISTTGPEGEPVTSMIGGPVTGNALGGGQTLAVGPTTLESTAMTSTGPTIAAIAEDMAGNAGAIPTTLKRLNLMTDALNSFQSGGGADVRAGAGKALQALKNMGIKGIDQKLIDGVANGDLEATQVFNANVKPLVIGELKAAAQGTGRVMRSEVDTFLAMADATTDPGALLKILNQAKFNLQVGYDESQKWLDYKKMIAKKDPEVAGLTLAEFPEWYASNYSEKDLPTETKGGENLGASPITSIKGVKGAPADSQSRPALDSFFGG